jgi:hypothetical protein
VKYSLQIKCCAKSSCLLVESISRSANHLAHLYAKLACTFEVTSSWLDCISDFLVVSLQAGSVILIKSLWIPCKKVRILCQSSSVNSICFC